MDTLPRPTDPTVLLLRGTCHQIAHTLHASLPPPVTDTQEDLARRDNAAIAHVASLLPITADEANLAAQYVTANSYAMDCLRLAGQHRGDASFFLKCNVRAATMMREARAIRALLQRVQAERRKLETDSAAAESAAWPEHRALGLMGDALGGGEPAAMAAARSPPEPTATNPVRAEEKPVASTPGIAA